MTSGGVLSLALSIALFSIGHIVLPLPPLRSRLVTWLGENTFRALYSALAFALLFWAALAYRDAPVIEVWYPPIGPKHLSLFIMPIASILLVAGLTTRGPSAIGGGRRDITDADPVGIMKIPRHPVMWAVALWGTAHLLANGDVASVILFGGITLLALIGAAAQDAKRRLQFGAEWQRFYGADLLPTARGASRKAHPADVWRRSAGGALVSD